MINQLEYLLKYKSKDVYFVNILDGDGSSKSMTKFNYLLNKDIYSGIKKYIFIGDMFNFKIWWNLH